LLTQFAHRFNGESGILNFALLDFGVLPKKANSANILSEKSIFLASWFANPKTSPYTDEPQL